MRILLRLEDYSKIRDRLSGRVVRVYEHVGVVVFDATEDDINLLKSLEVKYATVKALFQPFQIPVPRVMIPLHEARRISPDRLFYLNGYDLLLSMYRGYLALDRVSRPICVIDSGVNPHHSMFAMNYNTIVLDSVFEDDGIDDNGHGSHVAGIISTLLPYARIVSIKMFRRFERATTEHFISALDKSMEHNCAVVNMSFGGYPPRDEIEFIDSIIASLSKDMNVVFVSASGNDGYTKRVCYPCQSEHVICVGSVSTLLVKSAFSNVDPELKKPDYTSFGERVVSADAFSDDRLVEMTGTSMATPQVSAMSYVVYAIWEFTDGGRIQLLHRDVSGALSMTDNVKQALLDFSLQNNPFKSWSYHIGYGIASFRRLDLREVARSIWYRRPRPRPPH